jgi:hypothetical protein
LAAKLTQLKQKSFSQLGACLGKFIPAEHLHPTPSGPLSRRRFFSKENTFWAFFSQVLDADGGCQEVVRKLQAFAALKSTVLPSSSTAAYCQARKKLDLPSLEAILRYTATQLQGRPDRKRLKGRRVVVADGTGVSMPDTLRIRTCGPNRAASGRAVGSPKPPSVPVFVCKPGAC